MLKTTTSQIKSLVPKDPTPYSVRESRYQEGKLNQYQDFLYKRAMYGLSAYTEEQLSHMKDVKKYKILKVTRHAHEVLNKWKQEMLTEETNNFMSMLFPNSKLVKELVSDFSEPDPKFKCKTDMEAFGITKLDIIEKFIEEGVLPKNFSVLEEQD